MTRTRIPVQVATALVMASGAHAQDFADTQRMANGVLFTAQDAAGQRRAAEQRRVDDLAQQADQQEALLQAQAASVQQLGDELRTIRDERQLIDVAAAFDAMLVAKRWPRVRGFLADMLTVDLDGLPNWTPTTGPADTFVAMFPALIAGNVVLPRFNQQAHIAGDHATLSSDGYAWGRRPSSRAPIAGRFEYGFTRAMDSWKIDALRFVATAPSKGSE